MNTAGVTKEQIPHMKENGILSTMTICSPELQPLQPSPRQIFNACTTREKFDSLMTAHAPFAL
jgi:hypothetical protein